MRARAQVLSEAASASAARNLGACVEPRCVSAREFNRPVLAAAREVDVRALDALARSQEKRVTTRCGTRFESGVSTGLPCASTRANSRAERALSRASQACSARAAGDRLILVPALAVGANGHRLGYGRGFYDVTLPDFRPPAQSVVVAYEFQLLSELPSLEHDVASDLVVTDARTLAV